MRIYSQKQHRAVAFLIAVSLVFFVSGCGPRGPRGPQEMGPPEVSVLTLQPERVVLTTQLPGRVSAFLVADVRPQVSGIVQERLFKEGAEVQKGEPLYQIDPAMYEAALARAEANVAAVQARADRYEALVPVKAVSQQDYDDVEAALQQAKAALKVARVNRTYTTIPAPISGRIGRSSVTIGALATAYQPIPFATIQQLDPVYVDVPQSSVDLLQLKQRLFDGRLNPDGEMQNRVSIIQEDGMPYSLEGTLEFRDVTVDPSTGSVILRVVVPNPDGALLPGMFVRAVLNEGVQEGAILVPQQCVSRTPKGMPFSMVVDDDGAVAMKMLTIDRALGDRWLVSSGLDAGDRVIVEGLQRVRPGTPVKVVPFGSVTPKTH